MIFYNQKDEMNVIIVDCDCGCNDMIKITAFDDESNEYYISIISSNFTNQQKGIFKRIGHRIKLAWLMLIGKEYKLNELILTKSDMEELNNRINILLNNGKKKKLTEELNKNI